MTFTLAALTQLVRMASKVIASKNDFIMQSFINVKLKNTAIRNDNKLVHLKINFTFEFI